MAHPVRENWNERAPVARPKMEGPTTSVFKLCPGRSSGGHVFLNMCSNNETHRNDRVVRSGEESSTCSPRARAGGGPAEHRRHPG